MLGQGEVGFDGDASATVCGDPDLFGEIIGLHPCGPDYGFSFNPPVIGHEGR